MTDSKMPERIWAWHWEVDRHRGQWSEDQEIVGESSEYIRADLAHPAPVADAELEALVRQLGRTPLYEGSGEDSDLGERAADAITALRARTAQPVGVITVQDAAKVLLDGLSLRVIGHDHPQITPEMTIVASMFLSALLPEGGA